MAAKSLETLQEEAKALGIEVTGEEKANELKALILNAQPGDDDMGDNPPAVEPLTNNPPKVSTPSKGEPMVPLSEVGKLIEQYMAQHANDANKPISPKRVTEHQAHLWRFDGKWVVDFVDRNNDEYFQNKIHAFDKFNDQTRSFEPWVELVFQDDTTLEVPLKTYMTKRMPIYCTILKRDLIDKSYSTGEVEKMKEQGDKLVPSGVMVDQVVEMYEEVFTMKTPDGKEITVPSYIIA